MLECCVLSWQNQRRAQSVQSVLLAGSMYGRSEWSFHAAVCVSLLAEPSVGEVWSEDVLKLERSHFCARLSNPVGLNESSSSGQANFISKWMLHTGGSLGEIGMMENLFHEVGHALHSMLGHTRYQPVMGTI